MRDQWRSVGREMSRFLAVGALALLLNNALVMAFTEIAGFHYLLSIVATTLITTLLSFTLNRNWTFRKDGVMDWLELVRYLLGTICNLCIVMMLTWGIVRMGMAYYFACLIVAAGMAPVNFILHRQWSFGLGRNMVSPSRAI